MFNFWNIRSSSSRWSRVRRKFISFTPCVDRFIWTYLLCTYFARIHSTKWKHTHTQQQQRRAHPATWMIYKYCKERHFSCSSLLKITRMSLDTRFNKNSVSTSGAWHPQTPVYLSDRMECVHRWWCLWVQVEKMCRTWYLAPEIRFGMLRWFAKRLWCCGISAHTHALKYSVHGNAIDLLCWISWNPFTVPTLECAYSFKSECRWHFLHFHPWNSQTHKHQWQSLWIEIETHSANQIQRMRTGWSEQENENEIPRPHYDILKTMFRNWMRKWKCH